MSIVICADCSKQIDLDVEDNYSVSDDNSYLCEECSEKSDNYICGHWKATREEIKQHHFDEYQLGIL